MKRSFRLYYLFCVLGVFLLGAYPLYMGVRVIVDMVQYGAVASENYPKYLIPYTPIALSVLVGTLLMPWMLRLSKRFAQMTASGISLVVFFGVELLFENLVIVTETTKTTLESWQMYMCYVPREDVSIAHKAIDILIGEYSPWFKLHFYMIAVLLILALLNTVYGFGKKVTGAGNTSTRPLVLQTIATGMFLAMCVLACFTAFFRTGELQVSPLSALLMSGFFILLGLVAGLYLGSFLHGKRALISVVIPSITASAATLLMYIGEMCLLHGHLYQLGTGAFFTARDSWTLAPADVVITLASGVVCAVILWLIRAKKTVA